MSALPLVVVRPEPGNTATVSAARAGGLAARGFPLFEAEPCAWRCPDPAAFDGLLLASGNAVRHGGRELERLRNLPVHAVGEATAAVARGAGLQVATVGAGNLAELIGQVPRPARLLRLAGEEHVPLAPPPGVLVETCVVYRMRALPLPRALAEQLRAGCVVLLHSAAAARHFAAECDRTATAKGAVALACLAPRVAAAAGSGWLASHSASRPDDAALLALARRMCHRAGHGVTDSQSADGE